MRLWLIRHAKSSWSRPSVADFQRQLSQRGLRDGPRMTEWLLKQAFLPTWIWASDASRALETAGFVEAAVPDAASHSDNRLYGASAETILDVVRETPDSVESVAVVAHNPGITECVNLLAGEQAVASMPTFGIARLHWFGGLDKLAFGTATPEILMAPRMLAKD